MLETRRLLATVIVNTSADADARDAALSFREAIEVVDGTLPVSALSPQERAQVVGAVGSTNVIGFAIPGSGVHTIAPKSSLPAITTSVTIDGFSQPGASPNTLDVGSDATLLIEINGEFAGPNTNGLFFTGAGNNTVEGLVVNRYGTGNLVVGQVGGVGVYFANSPGGNTVKGCYLGLDPTGRTAEPNRLYQIVFANEPSGDVLGGALAADRNVIESGSAGPLVPFGTGSATPNGASFDRVGGPRVFNNYLGTDATGAALPIGVAAGNATALSLDGTTEAQIGGAAGGLQNVIVGLWIGSSTPDSGFPAGGSNSVIGNMIGVDVTGTHAFDRGGPFDAIDIVNSPNDLIGGSSPGGGNVIAGKGRIGIYVLAPSRGTNLFAQIAGNSIGTDAGGTRNFGESDGVVLAASGNFVGSPSISTAPNVIAFNSGPAVDLFNGGNGSGTAMNNRVIGNSIYSNGSPAILTAPPASPLAPSVTAVLPVPGGSNTEVKGVVFGTPKAVETIDLFSNPALDAHGLAEGQTFVGGGLVTLDAAGRGAFDITVRGGILPGQYVTATATDTSTSAFSNGLLVGATVTAPADFDGDGFTDQAVFRVSTAQWYVRQTTKGLLTPVPVFGASNLGDIPVVGDFDGVGHAEIAYFHPATADWFVLGPGGGHRLGRFGATNLTDIPVPGDYDGVGHAELAVFRPSTGQWFVMSPNGGRLLATFGASKLADIPVPGDYDGVGHTELAVFRPSTAQWFVLGPNGGHALAPATFGASKLADVPVEAPVAALTVRLKLGGKGGIGASSARRPPYFPKPASRPYQSSRPDQ